MRNGKVLIEACLPTDKRSAQTLAPTIDRLLDETKPERIDCVAVVIGPGSFTGLRVGIASAKMFAYAIGAKMVGVGTHETIAAALSVCPDEVIGNYVSIGVDAQRGDVVAQRFRRKAEDRFLPIENARLISTSNWFAQMEQETAENTDLNTDGPILFAGPALNRWAENVPDGVRLTAKEYWMPSARFAGILADERFKAGRLDDLLTLLPIYSRLSAAEEADQRRSVPDGSAGRF